MIKQSIRLVGCIIALFALILVFKHSHLMQEEKPLNTTERFNIAVLSTTISKERLVNELNALVDQYGAVLVKVVPNQDNYDSQKDIIWFGSLQPDGTSPRIRDNRISWLEPSVGGELIHSSDMGVRPLYGSYSMLGSTEFKVALAEWCNKNEMSIDFYKQYPLPAVFLVYFIQHGIGNAVLISFFLFLTTVIVWFVTHAKARALRLLGGVPLQRIHFEDTPERKVLSGERYSCRNTHRRNGRTELFYGTLLKKMKKPRTVALLVSLFRHCLSNWQRNNGRSFYLILFKTTLFQTECVRMWRFTIPILPVTILMLTSC